MKVHTCYTAALKQQVTSIDGVEHPVSMSVSSALMKHTSEFCLGALKTCACIFLKEWGYLSSLPSAQKPGVLSRKRAADLLVHSTKDNKARYPEFDRGFPRMPSYTRRAVIADALGLVSSYMSNHASWEKKDPSLRRKGRPLHCSRETMSESGREYRYMIPSCGTWRTRSSISAGYRCRRERTFWMKRQRPLVSGRSHWIRRTVSV